MDLDFTLFKNAQHMPSKGLPAFGVTMPLGTSTDTGEGTGPHSDTGCSAILGVQSGSQHSIQPWLPSLRV